MENIHQAIDIHIGKRVYQRRTELKLSLEKLSSYCDITFAELHRIEEGKGKVTAAQVFNISHALHIHISYFFDNNHDINRLITAYLRIVETSHRHKILRLIESMSTGATA